MKPVILLSLAISAHAATVVSGTIRVPTGQVASGSCSIAASTPFTESGGGRVIGAPVIVPFTAGVFTATLYPTTTGSPVSYYRVTCTIPLQCSTTNAAGSCTATQIAAGGRTIGPLTYGPRYWIVPATPSTTTIGAVEQATTPTWQQLLLSEEITWGGLCGC